MKERRAVGGLGVAMLMAAALIAAGVLTPGHDILPAWFVPIGALVLALGLVSSAAPPVERRAALVAAAAVVGSWASNVPLVKATALAAGGVAILVIAWRAQNHPRQTS